MQSQGRDSLRAPNGRLDLKLTGTDARPPRVMRAFAVYMGLALILAALIILFFVRHNVEANSKQRIADHATFVSSTVIPKLLPPESWDKPLSGALLDKVDVAVRTDLLENGGIMAEFFSPDGVVIYSSDRARIGTRSEQSGRIKEAFSGDEVTDVTTLSDRSGADKETRAIAAYSGVTYPGAPEAAGVFMLYNDYGQAAGSIRQQALPLAGAVLLILLLLYLALFPVLRRLTRQLSYSNDELRRQAADLNDNLVERAAIEQRLRETIDDLEKSENSLEHAQEETIMRLSMAVERRDQETGDHIERMGRYCSLLASKLGWNDQRCELLRIAAPLHDVGKIAIPDSILLKPGALTPEERVEIEKHAEVGHEILAGSDSPLLDLAARIALSHHEHWDGNGYPNGLAGEEIPIEGRMAAIADVFDALTSDRVYRPAMTVERSLAIMSEGRGSHFDPNLLDTFFDSIVEVLLIRDGHVEEKQQQRQKNLGHRRRQRRAVPVASSFGTADEDGGQARSMVG
ncbi:MAG: HD domain-containing protein [Thermoleophilaceae bacterium]|nr:HD domain-containing protein [Thermoleophilaceae bacterium]